MATADAGGCRDAEADALFPGLENLRGLVLAVSGGPDSTALLVLAARWAQGLRNKTPAQASRRHDRSRAAAPKPAREARAVKRLARQLRRRASHAAWRGNKPKTGLQEAARVARYRLLAQAATRARRLRTCSDRPYARRSGGNGAVSPRARQRPDRACADGVRGACFRSARTSAIFVVRPLLVGTEGAADRHAQGAPDVASQRRSLATATRALPGRGCGR